jgi:hypothetical protein
MNIACVAFAFGVPSNTKANQRIATMACGIQIPSHPGIYTQKDINIKALQEDGYRNRMQVTYTVERPGYPPPTLRIARGAVEWAKANRVTTLYIACAYPHIGRCTRDLQLAIRENNANIEIKICPEAREQKGWFCKDCTQSRARLRWLWYIREVILRIIHIHVQLYKKIAS